LYCQK
jgi:hypothetical protein